MFSRALPNVMRFLTVVLLVAYAAGCDTEASPAVLAPAVTVASDRATYQSGETAVFVVRNGSPDTLYASLCGSVVEQATGTAWSYRESYICAPEMTDGPVPMAVPGGTQRVELAGHFVRDLAPGTFRLRLWLTDGKRARLPDSTRTSNSFDVALAGGRAEALVGGPTIAPAAPSVDRAPDTWPDLVGGLERLQASVRYPAAARSAGVEGRVVVEVVVGEDGAPTGAAVVRSVSPELDAEAVRATLSAEYTAGTTAGRPVTRRLTLPVTFRLP